MSNYNVIGDIAGNYLTLMALLDKMPKDAELISLGDPNDRGPRSKEVIEFLMKNGRTVNSNHAHMLVEEWKQSAMPGAYPIYYGDSIFFVNGGNATMGSYAGTASNQWGSSEKQLHELIPKSHVDFLEKCPMYIANENFFFSHAPLHIQLSIKKACELGNGFADWKYSDFVSDHNLLWNRDVPQRPHEELNGKINVFGHNSSDKVKVFTTQYPFGIKVDNEKLQELIKIKEQHPIYGICLDTSLNNVLTGLHIPSMTLYHQEYID